MNLLIIITLFSLASFVIGGLLGFAAEKLKVEGNPIVDEIEKVLPQTQCGQCGYAGCRQYAEAVASGKAGISLCVPGGQRTINEVAKIMNVPAVTVDAQDKGPQVAYITENLCIGCHKCASGCPVDAIVGSGKMIHTVLASRCTGCKLCVETCPTKCIAMLSKKQTPADWDHRYLSIEEQRNVAAQRGVIR